MARQARQMRPERRHALTALVLTVMGTVVGMWLFGLAWAWDRLLLAWLVAVTVATFLWYGYDKRQALLNGRRVPEVVLHGLAFFGGSFGAGFGMWLFRHKTVKGSFRLVFFTIVALQLALVAVVVWRVWRG